MKTIAFIINPIAGTNLRTLTEQKIKKIFPEQKYKLQIEKTEYAGHATELTQQFIAQKVDAIVVAGGDGSVNEVGSLLRHTGIPFGIIPVGSGNGLAHHLKIPLQIEQSLQLVKSGKTIPIDVGIAQCQTFGEEYFFSNCGFGFDSETIHAYDDTKQRGFFTYLYMMIRSFATLNPKRVRIQFEGFDRYLTPFVFTIANSSHYGYNIKAVPNASITDGLLDTLLIPDTNFLRIVRYAAYSLSNSTKALKKVAEYHRAKQMNIFFEHETKFQIDGEPFLVQDELTVCVDSGAVKVFVP